MTTNNTFKHISPDAKYVDFDPAGTSFPANVLNVQDALALTSPTQYATTTTAGVITIATQAEVLAGTDTKKVVTPATLAARLAYPQSTTSQLGVIQLASNTEAQTGTNTEKAIVPSSLKYTIEWYFTNRTALEGRLGVLKLSTMAAATAGVDDSTAMTPLKVKQAIANATAQIPSYTSATESVSGLVRLATLGQARQGTLRDGYAISPYTLMNLTGNISRKGIVQAATQAQVNVGTDESLYVSAKGFKTYIATSTNIGTVKLTDIVGTAGTGIALSATAKVVPSTGGTMTGALNVNADIKKNGSNVVSEAELNIHVPIGTVTMWLGDDDPSTNQMIANGRLLSKTSYPELFAAIGYKFGGTGDSFALPDMRGLFVRGAGRGKDILAQAGTDSNGVHGLGYQAFGGSVGSVQTQQIRKHKHLGFGEATKNWIFGNSSVRGNMGTNGGIDYDNYLYYTNDGSNYVNPVRPTLNAEPNPDGIIGDENRPWNMSVNYIIKVK